MLPGADDDVAATQFTLEATLKHGHSGLAMNFAFTTARMGLTVSSWSAMGRLRFACSVGVSLTQKAQQLIHINFVGLHAKVGGNLATHRLSPFQMG